MTRFVEMTLLLFIPICSFLTILFSAGTMTLFLPVFMIFGILVTLFLTRRSCMGDHGATVLKRKLRFEIHQTHHLFRIQRDLYPS